MRRLKLSKWCTHEHGEPDFEADIELLATVEGGRSRPSVSGYRPHHQLREGVLTRGSHEYVGVHEVPPGAIAKARVSLLSRELVDGSLVVGMRIPFSEGRRVVGYATVTSILNPRLAATKSMPGS